MFWRVMFSLWWIQPVLMAALPPEAISILESFPGKKLSLQAIWFQAMKVSDSYRSLKSLQLTAESMELQALAPTDSRAFAKVGYSDDKSDPVNPLSPIQNRGSRYSLGVETKMLTGSSLSLEIAHSLADSKSASFVGDLNYAESRVTLGLQQSLWRNAFGKGMRSTREAVQHAANANRMAYEQSTEEWALQIAELFYGAWLSQQKLLLANEAVFRRERLLKVVEIRGQRGTSEPPDVLQVRSALARTRIQRAQARHELADRWRVLVTMLKLPASFLQIDPAEIPIAFEFELTGTVQQCGQSGQPSAAPQNTAETVRYELAKKSAEFALAAAKAEDHPDLDLSVTLGANSVAGNSNSTVDDLKSIKYPAYSASLIFALPIGDYASRARVQLATADLIRAQSQWQQTKDLLNTQWQNRCLELHRLIEARGELEKALAWQSERQNLEEARFGLGRTTTFQVIQAGDDRAETASQLAYTQAQLFQMALAVNKMSGELIKQLRGLGTL